MMKLECNSQRIANGFKGNCVLFKIKFPRFLSIIAARINAALVKYDIFTATVTKICLHVCDYSMIYASQNATRISIKNIMATLLLYLRAEMVNNYGVI